MRVSGKAREKIIYLDCAAAAYPLPRVVRDKITQFISSPFGNPGRSGHPAAIFSSGEIFAVREKAARLFNTEPERVVFTQNTTYALNLAISGFLKGKTGVNVISSVLEHNSVLRPLYAHARSNNIELRLISPPRNERGIDALATLRSILSKIDGKTALAVFTARSNITGEDMPIKEIGAMMKKLGIPFIVDGAQAAGHRKIDLTEENIDILCIPGHKGLMGCMTSGAMLIARDAKKLPEPVIFGGSGSATTSADMPAALPERLEAGTLPVLPIVAMGAGIDFITRIGLDNIDIFETETTAKAVEILRKNDAVKLYAPFSCRGLLLFNIVGYPSEEIAEKLSERGIYTRAGLHCAPLAHEYYNTSLSGLPRSAVRISWSRMTEPKELYRALEIAASIKGR